MSGRGRGRRNARGAPKSPARRGSRSVHFEDENVDPQITQADEDMSPPSPSQVAQAAQDMTPPPLSSTRQAAEASQEMPPPPVPSQRATRSSRSRNKDTEVVEVAEAAEAAAVGVVSRRFAPSKASGPPPSISAMSEESWADPSEAPGFQSSLNGDDLQDNGAATLTNTSSNDSDVFHRKAGKKARLLKSLLPTLLQTAENVYSHLLVPPASPEDESEWHDDLKVLEGMLISTRDHYNRYQAAPFINPATALEMMGGDASSEAWLHGSRITVLANIASLLADLVKIDQMDKLVLLQQWDTEFPKAFISDMGLNCAPPAVIVHHILAIRSNLLYFTLRKLQEIGSEHDQFDSMCEIFLQDTKPEDLHKLRGTNHPLVLKPVVGVDWNKHEVLRTYAIDQVWVLYDLLSNPLHLDRLQEHSREDLLVQDLRNFANKAFEELLAQERAPDQIPSIDRPTPFFSPAPEHHLLYGDLSSPMHSQASSVSRPITQSGLDALAEHAHVQALKQTAERAQQDYGLSHEDLLTSRQSTPAGNYPGSQTSHYSQPMDMYTYPPPVSQDYQASGSIFAESAARATKRSAPADETSDGFETDNRAPPTKRQRVSKPRKSRAKSAAARVGEALEEPLYTPPSGPIPDLDTVYQKTRALAALNKKPKEPQVRTPWSRNDCRMLVRAVGTYECKWSLIEDNIKTGMIRFEHPRDQQALRDKARLLKQDFLKTDAPLPPGFDLVVLGRKEKMAVISCGRNPDRKEADIKDGVPTNTEYIDPAAAANQVEEDPILQARSEPQSQPEVQSQVEDHAEAQIQSDLQLQIQPDLQIQADLQSQAEMQSQVEMQSQSEMQTQPEHEPQPEIDLQPHPVMQPKPDMQPEPVMQPDYSSLDAPNEDDGSVASEVADSVGAVAA